MMKQELEHVRQDSPWAQEVVGEKPTSNLPLLSKIIVPKKVERVSRDYVPRE